MTVLRLDNVSLVVNDIEPAIAFFAELGLELEGRADIEGPWADQCCGMDGIRCEIAMMKTPDGHGKVELTKFHTPQTIGGADSDQPNALGWRRVMFAVEDIEDTVARLRKHGGEVLGSIARYEDVFLLCYVRGPEGILVGLAQEL